MKEEEIICGRENVESFKKELRASLPGVFPVIKGLYDAGMIEGLRGIKLTKITGQKQNGEAGQEQPPQAQQYCFQCVAFKADTVGDGSGIGQCLENVPTRRTKYPQTSACNQFNRK